MRSPIEPLFRASYALYKALRWAFRFADLNVSVVWAAVYYAGGSLFYLMAVLGFESLTVSWVYQCLFPPEEATLFVIVRDFVPAVSELVREFPVISAFVVFVAGQTAAAYYAFTTFHWVMTFKLTYVLGSDQYGQKDVYSPFDGESSEASDPLTF
jgi:hypothetical protein